MLALIRVAEVLRLDASPVRPIEKLSKSPRGDTTC
jgi:hypothetical protein